MRAVLAVLPVLLAACAAEVVDQPAAPQVAAELVLLVDANIVTMDPERPRASAMAWRDDRIVALGTEAEVRAAVDEPDRVLDLDGATVVPGFIETHDHLVMGAGTLAVADLTPFTHPTLADALVELGETEPDEHGWIVGFGLDPSLVPEQRGPTLAELDAISPTRPLIAYHLSGHAAYVNSLALQHAGIDTQTPDPAGGYYERDDDGHLTGYLSGQPTFLELRPYPAPTVEVLLANAQRRAEAGVTTASEMGFMSPLALELARDATSREDFPVRVIGAIAINMPDFEEVARDRARYETRRLTLKFGKMWADGSPQGGTAYFRDGYHDPAFGGAGPRAAQSVLDQTVASFYELGLWPAIHANGDGAVDVALDAIAHAQRGRDTSGTRPHLIHAQLVQPDQIARMAELGVLVTFFTAHVYWFGDLHLARTMGPDRGQRLDPMGDAFAAGLRPAMHNDPPVTPVDPLLSMWTAVVRQSSTGRPVGADQAITAEQALAAYTTNAAYLFGIEADAGSLEVGKLADFVVLDRDPLAVPGAEIRAIEVLATVVGGGVVYRSDAVADRIPALVRAE